LRLAADARALTRSRRGAAVLAALVAVLLALPAQAAAHGRSATVALDYRLTLAPETRALSGVHVRILDGDREFQVRVDPGVALVVRGEIGEPMLRIDDGGIFANASSPTATADRIVATGKHGWVRLGGGRTIAWHDHRLGPPPASTPGPVGRFVVPVDVNGHRAEIEGTFIRVARPALWPWLLVAVAIVGGILVAIRRRSARGPLTIALGTVAGIAALVEVTTFAVRDAPSGGVAWLQIGTSGVIAIALAVLLVRLRGRGRVHAAGVVGAIAAAVSIESLPVYWHGNVISALPGSGVRAVCALALVCGVAAAVLSFLPDFDEPVRVRAPRARPVPR
jgi:hypothetical protein